MPTINLQSRFAWMVQRGRKRQTIIPVRKNCIRVGEELVFYKGLRRHDAKKIGRAVCTSAHSVIIDAHGINVMGTDGAIDIANMDALNTFARDDGFTDWEGMRQWFYTRYGLPFSGILIKWDSISSKEKAMGKCQREGCMNAVHGRGRRYCSEECHQLESKRKARERSARWRSQFVVPELPKQWRKCLRCDKPIYTDRYHRLCQRCRLIVNSFGTIPKCTTLKSDKDGTIAISSYSYDDIDDVDNIGDVYDWK